MSIVFRVVSVGEKRALKGQVKDTGWALSIIAYGDVIPAELIHDLKISTHFGMTQTYQHSIYKKPKNGKINK